MIGTRFDKPLTEVEKYTECAKWCFDNDARIEDKGDYYECVDNTPSEEMLKLWKENDLKQQLQEVTYQLSQLNGTAMCGYSVDNDTQYDVIVNDELTTMNEEQFNNYFDELTDKRNEIVKQLKGL